MRSDFQFPEICRALEIRGKSDSPPLSVSLSLSLNGNDLSERKKGEAAEARRFVDVSTRGLNGRPFISMIALVNRHVKTSLVFPARFRAVSRLRDGENEIERCKDRDETQKRRHLAITRKAFREPADSVEPYFILRSSSKARSVFAFRQPRASICKTSSALWSRASFKFGGVTMDVTLVKYVASTSTSLANLRGAAECGIRIRQPLNEGSSEGETHLAETQPPIRARAGGCAGGRAWREQRATAGRDAACPDADACGGADECRPPSRGGHGGGTGEGFRSRRRSRLPPSGNPPCNPRCKPPRRYYHAPLSREPLRPPARTTSCPRRDERRRSRAMMAAALCPVPLVSVPVPPTRCGKRRTPPPANKSANRLIDRCSMPRWSRRLQIPAAEISRRSRA